MTYRSESRGFMYTAPPGPDDEAENRSTDVEATETAETTETTATEATASEGSPELESTTAATDANWTGTVSADD